MHARDPHTATTTAVTFLRRACLAILCVVLATGGPAVATASVATASVASSAADPVATDDVTWTVRTASNDFGSHRTSFVHSVNPGGEIQDALVVANHGDDQLQLAVYAADGYTTESGQLDLLTPDVESVAVGTWVQAATGASVTVEPGASVEIPVTIAVPENATPGDYAGGIVTSLVQQDDGQGITVDRRLGIRFDLRVGGELRPALAVEDVHADYAGTSNPVAAGDATVTYTIHNVGNAVLSAQQAVTVSGPFGLLRADAGDVATPPQLLPGEEWTVSVPVDGVAPALRLAAEVTLTPLLTDAAGSTSALDPVHATARTWALPWTLLLAVVLVAAAAVVVTGVVRRRRRQRAAGEDLRVQQAVQQALLERQVAQTSVGDRAAQ